MEKGIKSLLLKEKRYSPTTLRMRTLMLHKYLIIAILLLFSGAINAQDTIKIGPSYTYTEAEYSSLYGKGFHGEYGREDIIYSDNHKRIEYCYYYNNERICKGHDYFITDSTFAIEENYNSSEYSDLLLYKYQKLDTGKYLIRRDTPQFYETAIATEIFPLIIEGQKSTISKINADTLWTTDYVYNKYNYSHPFPYEKINIYKNTVKGKVFDYNQIEYGPTYTNGLKLDTLHSLNHNVCISQLSGLTIMLVCTITTEGKIKVSDIITDNMGCLGTAQHLVLRLNNFKELNSATVNGEAVNARWFIPVIISRDGNSYVTYGDNFYNSLRDKYIKTHPLEEIK